MTNEEKKRATYHSRIVLGILVPMMVVAGMFVFFTNKDTSKKEKIEASEVVTAGDFRLTADNRWDSTDQKSYAELDWADIPDLSSEGYRIYQSEDGTNWDLRSARYGQQIEVLNIFPDSPEIYETMIQEWMHDPDIGKGLINVTPISMSNFNDNPDSYLRDAQGEYRYDVIFVGTANANNNVSFNETAVDRLIEFIEAGRGLLVGHDVLSGNTRNWGGVTADLSQNNRLAQYLGIGLRNQYEEKEGFPSSKKVTIINNGYLMKYPHEFEDDMELEIPQTHTFGQVAGSLHNGTIWLEFTDYSISMGTEAFMEPDSTTNFYLVTNGNAGMIQTGHMAGQIDGESTTDERKIIANTLYNLAQITEESNANDYTVLDNVAPDQPDFFIRCGDEDNVNIRVDATDRGKEYQWYIEANTKNDGVKNSHRVRETITSNIAGYFYEVSDSSISTLAAQVEAKKNALGRIETSDFDLYVAPNDDSVRYETATTFTLSEKNTSGRYVHIVAVDRANNVSEVASQQIRDITQPVDFEIERTENRHQLVEVSLEDDVDKTMEVLDIQVPKNVSIDNYNTLVLPNTWTKSHDTTEVNYNTYSFVIKDNNEQSVIANFLENLLFSIADPVNQEGGVKVILHEKEGEESVNDFCWNASIPQKINIQAYTERFGQFQRFAQGDILYDQQLRIGGQITAQPNDFELFTFLEHRDRNGEMIPPIPLGDQYTVTKDFQEGAFIYANRQVMLHVRQVVLEPENQLVSPEEGYLNLKTSLFDVNSGNYTEDTNQLIQVQIPSQNNDEVPDFEMFAVSTKHMTDDGDLLRLNLILPEFYEYRGHFFTQRHLDDPNDPMGADHQGNLAIYGGDFERPRVEMEMVDGYFITIYISPTEIGRNPQPYSWDYKKNDLGRITTR
ncbi:hypothetical protein [Enterococcus sp. AZ072]|uniref:hypothetical protein n=1 Tax=unclassified Enterococcus TaxID=2608891 RepID=UPI003D2E0CF9